MPGMQRVKSPECNYPLHLHGVGAGGDAEGAYKYSRALSEVLWYFSRSIRAELIACKSLPSNSGLVPVIPLGKSTGWLSGFQTYTYRRKAASPMPATKKKKRVHLPPKTVTKRRPAVLAYPINFLVRIDCLPSSAIGKSLLAL